MRSFHHVRRRAAELARTGQHIDCLTIEMALEREGFSSAFEALRDAEFRARLTAICSAHWGLSAPEGSLDSAGSPDDAYDGPAFDGVRFPLPLPSDTNPTDEA